MTETNGLLERVDRLESENRKIKWAIVILVLTGLGLLTVFHMRTGGKIEVTDLTVRDKSGAIVATLASDNHGICLKLTARSGVSNAALCADNFYGSNLDLENNNPETRASLSSGRKLYEGGDRLVPGLIIKSEGGQNMLAVNVGSEAQLLFGHSEDDSSVLLSPGQTPAIQVVDARGKGLALAH